MYHLYTHNDLDGVGCGIIAKLAFGEDVVVSYNSISHLNTQVEAFLNEEEQSGHLIITDLAVNDGNEKRISQYVEKGGKALLIDHHKTALHLNKNSWAEVTVEQEDGKLTSATSLFYQYALKQGWLKSSPIIDEFVELVRQYDTWEWEVNENLTAKRLNDLFFMFSIEEFEEKVVQKLMTAHMFTFDEAEQTLLNVEEARVERYIKRKKREVYQVTINDHVAGVVHAESYHSELGNELSKEFSYLDYIAIVMVGSKRISFRTMHDDIDVSAVAANYEGGGHQKAAGCNLTEQAFKQFVEKTYYSEPIKRDAHNNVVNLKESEKGSLYITKEKDLIFTKQDEQKQWILEVNHTPQNQRFASFDEAERYIKRTFAAWLAYDIKFEEYVNK